MSDLLNQSGVYRITCKPTGKQYVGSAKKFRARWSLHRVQLRQGKHHAPYLQNSWDKYGADAIAFEVLLVCDHKMALFYEQIMLDALKPEFNTSPVAGSALGVKHTEQAKQNMSKSQREVRPKYEWKGQQLCLSDIAELECFDVSLLIARVMGLSKTVEEAIAMGDSQFKLHEYDGRQQNLSAWAKELGVHVARLNHYIKRGLTLKQAVYAIEKKSKSLSFQELCRLNGANVRTAKSRVQKGMGIMAAITKPAGPTGVRHQRKEATQ
jgi:hypothetical protein